MVCEPVHRWQDSGGNSPASMVFEQGDGRQPASRVSVKWPGDKGFSVSSHRFAGGAHFQAVPADHLVVVQPQRVGLIKCQVGDDRLDHSAPEWNVTVCPAGRPCVAESDDDLDVIVLSIPVNTFAFAAAQSSRPSVELDSQLHGRDDGLTALIGLVMQHANGDEPRSPLWWDQATDRLVDHLLGRYSRTRIDEPSGRLSRDQLLVVRDFVHDNISEPMTIESLAGVVRQSRSHFTRMFTRTTGLSPHHYVMLTRLEVAQQLLRHRRYAPAAAAAEAGFVDQSHLARWTKRVFGGTVGDMRPEPASGRRRMG